ncbi:MAG: hypothetical protein KY475_19410, partial [Planctomycetes bacterium]|nr:hypothetical protein [Planctomycetota bacterium]
ELFGDVGPYERIIGRVRYAIDPQAPQNQAIVDLEHAPTNDDRRVEFSADLFILAPKDLAKCSGAALYDVNNRGNKLALRFFDHTAGGNNPQSAGNGYLMRQGLVVVWSGWSGELLPGDARLRLTAPTAKSENGEPVTGPVRYEICVDKPTPRTSVNRENHGAYRPTEAGLQNATLTWRLRPGDPRVPIPREQFHLHVSDVEEAPGLLPLVEIEVAGELQPGYLYELIYEARDPLVHGVCFAAVRDLMAALKHGEGKGNPLLRDGKPAFERTHGFGVSQSGRFLRELLYSGFNEDERGRRVFDGLMPHVAGGGLGSFNHRFAQPTAFNTQHELHSWPCDRFPFAYELQKDPITGLTDGIQRKAEAAGVAPKIMHTQSSAEYWSRSGSLPHTDPLGTRDAEPPANVRIYAFGGTQHGPASFPPDAAGGQHPANPADYRPLLRALLTALDQWVRDDVEPPASVYPKIADGTLVSWEQSHTGFPAIPGVRYPEVIQQPSAWDLGPHWRDRGITSQQPPRPLGDYQVLAPGCDVDGNDVGCLQPPEVAVPVATYTGWSLRRRDIGAQNELVGLNGAYLPFPKTKAERESSGDPRQSLEERYRDWPTYRKRLARRCREMTAKRYLLEEDIGPILEREEERHKALFE